MSSDERDLKILCHAVIRWARVPGDHGGNPYCKPFVKLAEQFSRERGWLKEFEKEGEGECKS